MAEVENPFDPKKEYRTTFDSLLLKGVRAGQLPARTKSSKEWFRNKAQELSHITARRILREEEKDRFTVNPELGTFYLYVYDAKHKATLPYWDSYPVCLPIEYYKDGWLGLNFHYLPLPLRAKLMDALYRTAKHPGEKWDTSTFLNVNYPDLRGLSRVPYFKPTIKRYLANHVKSRLMRIYPTEWDIALFLPLAHWNNATQEEVWQASRDIIGLNQT